MLVREGSVDRTRRWEPEPENCDEAAGRAGTGRPPGRPLTPAPGPTGPGRPLAPPAGPGPVGRDPAGRRPEPGPHGLPSLVTALEPAGRAPLHDHGRPHRAGRRRPGRPFRRLPGGGRARLPRGLPRRPALAPPQHLLLGLPGLPAAARLARPREPDPAREPTAGTGRPPPPGGPSRRERRRRPPLAVRPAPLGRAGRHRPPVPRP